MKTVLITGASRGIGEAIARRFADGGYNVVINYHSSDDRAAKLAEELQLRGVRAIAIKADVGNASQVKTMVEKVLSVFGKIDVLVNNAGISLDKLLIDSTTADIEDVVLTNLLGAIYTSKMVLPSMISNHFGRIVNISSVWGQVGGSMETVYSATKGGIISFTKALAKEMGPSNITVNCVCPGVILTDMTRGYSVDTLKNLEDNTSVGRIGQPQDVAGIVYFLASDEASYITGEAIGVNGGMI